MADRFHGRAGERISASAAGGGGDSDDADRSASQGRAIGGGCAGFDGASAVAAGDAGAGGDRSGRAPG